MRHSTKLSTWALFSCIIVWLTLPARADDFQELLSWAEQTHSLKLEEKARLQSGETWVNGYAIFGESEREWLVSGEPEFDQLYFSRDRIIILNKEIEALNRLVAVLERELSNRGSDTQRHTNHEPSAQPVVRLDSTTVAPLGPITVHFTGGGGLAHNAWIGIVPSDVPHGNERTNDDHDLAYQYLEGRSAGTLSFKAPERPGNFDFRMHDTDDDGRELASVSFRVVNKDPGHSRTRSFSGIWDSDFGLITLHQQGNRIAGTYSHEQGKIEGVVTDGVLTGTWSEAPSYSPPQDSGRVVLKLSKDGRSFTGSWGYGDKIDSGTWEGSRK